MTVMRKTVAVRMVRVRVSNIKKNNFKKWRKISPFFLCINRKELTMTSFKVHDNEKEKLANKDIWEWEIRGGILAYPSRLEGVRYTEDLINPMVYPTKHASYASHSPHSDLSKDWYMSGPSSFRIYNVSARQVTV